MKRISDNSALIQAAFEGFTPSAELTERVKAKRFGRRKKRPILRRAVVIPVAACLAVLFTVTAAAELFGFDEILGRYIRIDDSELAQSLIGTVSDVEYTVSDNEYQIEIIGVSGSSESLFAAVKISRRDGAPVVDHFLNGSVKDSDNIRWLKYMTDILTDDGKMCGYNRHYGNSSIIDENGDILYVLDLYGEDLDGKIISIDFERLVLSQEGREFEKENNVCYSCNSNIWGYYSSDTGELVDIDDSAIVCLPLKWTLSFKYNVSDNAPEVRYADISKQDNSDCVITELKASASGVRISFTSKHDILRSEYGKEAHIIMCDNTHIPLSETCSGSSFDGEHWYNNVNFEYSEEVNTKINQFIDITQAKAVYFDGVTYELE
ncbi:MAG: hypothetical protein ACI4XF_01725 [Oscillospiraceae bacterium]